MNGSYPSRLALAVLEKLLDAGRREAILGDLIEQYREDIAPHRNALQAWIWCWRQTTSFVTWEATGRVARGFKERNPILFWTGAIAAVQLFFTVLMPTVLGFTMQGALFALLVVSLATSALVSANFRLDWRAHGSRGLVAALVFAALAVATINFGVMVPNAFVPSVLVLMFLSGFDGAWRASHSDRGTLVAMMAGVIGSAIAMPMLTIGMRLGYEQSHPPLATFMPVAIGVSVVMGSLGAHAANGLKALMQWRHCSVAVPTVALFTLVGCSGLGVIGDLVQEEDVSPTDAIELAGMPFGTDRVTVRGWVTILLFPPSGEGMFVVHGNDGKRYAVSMAETKGMARQGLTRFSIGPGERVTISAVLARDGKKIKEFTAARADRVTNSKGKVIFERMPPGS